MVLISIKLCERVVNVEYIYGKLKIQKVAIYKSFHYITLCLVTDYEITYKV